MAGGSNYLDGEPNQFGLTYPLPNGLGEQASAIVDAFLKRTEGVVYETDVNGNPCCMKALMPSFTYKISAVAPGTNVVATVTPANVRPDMVGEVLVLDRINPDAKEAVVISATSGNSQVTFKNVQFAHVDQTKADMGLVLTEERPVPTKRSVVRYSKFPAAAILSLMGRYGYGRRSDQVSGLYQEMNLLAAVQTFGGPPQWVPIDTTQSSWSDATGEIWVPAGMLLAYYSDVKIKYVAGFPEPPDDIVRATAAIAQSLVASGTFGGGAVKSISAGDTRIDRFGSTNIDDDSRRLLEHFKARSFF